MLKIKNKYLNFKANIAKMKTSLFVNNNNKNKLIDKFFVYINKNFNIWVRKTYKTDIWEQQSNLKLYKNSLCWRNDW